MSKTFVMGDSHGAAKAIQQCFDRADFDMEKDTLIHLGDISDGWPETYESVELLMKVKNLIICRGNHDKWTEEFLIQGFMYKQHRTQGGKATWDSYWGRPIEDKDRHREFLRRAVTYYLDDKNRLFVHAGISTDCPVEEQTEDELIWSRHLFYSAVEYMHDIKHKLTQYDLVFIGHTSTEYANNEYCPVRGAEVYMLDTGAGWGDGLLTMMDVETKDYVQSDPVSSLYPNAKGRRC